MNAPTHPGRARRTLAATASGLVLLLAGCAHGGDDHADGTSTPATAAASSTAPASATGDHDQADVDFAVAMVPHHLQAVELADLVPSRTTNPEVLALAREITAAQQPEVEQLTTWLATWGADPSMGHDEMTDHGAHGADGMATADDLRALGALSGDAFDQRWLALMVAHHEGAVAMAKDVLANGRHAPTRALATAVVAEQQAEITRMQALLSR